MIRSYLRFLLILLLSISCHFLYAQDGDYSREKDQPEKVKNEKKKKPKDTDDNGNYIFGGGLGLQLGNPVYAELSPKIGYKFKEKFLAGGGLTYIYYSETSQQYGSYKTSIYGGSLFGSYEPIEDWFGWIEYELLSYQPNDFIGDYQRKLVGSPFVGIGYRQQIGEKGFIQLMFLYNLNYTTDSPYSSPVVPRISFFF